MRKLYVSEILIHGDKTLRETGDLRMTYVGQADLQHFSEMITR